MRAGRARLPAPCLLAAVLLACASGNACTSEASHAGDAADGGMQDASDAFGNPHADAGASTLHDAGLLYASFAKRPCPSASTLTYEGFAARFFDTYCQPCHASQRPIAERNGAPPSVTFDDLASIRAQRKAIWDQAGDQNTRMPAAMRKPTSEERVQLGEWLACGAKSESDGEDAGAP